MNPEPRGKRANRGRNGVWSDLRRKETLPRSENPNDSHLFARVQTDPNNVRWLQAARCRSRVPWLVNIDVGKRVSDVELAAKDHFSCFVELNDYNAVLVAAPNIERLLRLGIQLR
jgi:hypothetical protein